MERGLAAGEIDGYCAGEPWNARAVHSGIGFTAVTSQTIWPNHPEKVLACTREFAVRYPNTARALIMTLLDAARYIDSQRDKRAIAGVLSAADCIATDIDTIAGRLQGLYDHGQRGAGQAGARSRRDPHPLRFFAEGEVSYPYLSDAMWFMSQQRRWGLLQADPDYLGVAAAVNQIDLYQEAASALRVPLPASRLRSSRLIDAREWSGHAPSDYARSFPICYRAPAKRQTDSALA